VRQSLDRVHRGVFATADGQVVQRTELDADQQALFRACEVKPPPLIEAVEPAQQRLFEK
jgi:hypothetical protein